MKLQDFVLTEGMTGKAPSDELKRLANHYKNSKLTGEKLRNTIGNELEALEYSPEEIADLVPKIMDMVSA
jgi:hypothetical protein